MQNEERIVLVDGNDTQAGAMGKLEAHKKGLLHRAFSIFIGNNKGEIMLQKRALGKYHSGGLWTNTCCGHPRDGEGLLSAAHRRLKEEMGFDCPLKETSTLIYRVDLDHGLQENEFLHILTGTYNGMPISNPEEASDWKWATFNEIQSDISKNPNDYTHWFKLVLEKAKEKDIVPT
ncbi:isopentenyl-diphosphate Delta-isomerase [Candidatus Kaiserbacteria bacterium]|nr:isopentenyl-diphosphate Delta-isomerase [Candidatus Kaiserbacteria bacterium]